MTLRTRVGQLVAYFFRSLLWSLNILLVLYTCLAYWLLYSLPVEHWTAGMIMITLPVAIFLNLIVVILWLTTSPWRSWLSGIVVILGLLLFGHRTFVWNSEQDVPAGFMPVKVFSYNAHTFGLEDYWTRYRSSPRARRIINYVLRYDAPIKCFQEFATASEIPDYDILLRFKMTGYPYSALLNSNEARAKDGYIGIATFSRYPIIASGSQAFYGANGVVWANIKIGNDTIRVINVHLQSMGIRVGRVLRQNELKKVRQETRGVLSALRNGFIERNEQVRVVEKFIQESPYPVIVTGDHNDTPYSVVYERLRRILPNSFEDAGRGFGFTYNRLPGFIRIDNQFHDPKLPVQNFETINYIGYSDHYPIVGTYLVKK
ncbi:endonuclease/exonuclease/phosphatase family protein [Spirosoma sp. BT702]|uniref:Endonuclease/exonuclease/phosphatase family protein n=1 Tax=Spirosoma profusum TaxID=2771354 RepID=A0A927ANP1_9BACT|nr:endonuclease/exonuclease/phosphatase family protein [Spirosoma profusum]MBD2702239.1 endonuclease/exonuclease/phosphatase family protein [Spirosoma profusum]